MALETYGWNDFWQQAFETHAAQGLVAGRVVVQHRERYGVATDNGEYSAELSGRLRYEAVRHSDLPAVGDFVALKPPGGDGPAIIQAVIPRRTAFLRKAAGERTEDQVVAANIDTIFILSALDRTFNLRRMERYLTLAWTSGASPVVVLNKADLCDDISARLGDVNGVAFGVPIHVISALTNRGLEEIEPYLQKGCTIGVLGPSGVGKSTLINHILGRDAQATQAVRQGDDRGRHTTTHRELFVSPTGALIIDTPGMRELQLWKAEEGLEITFEDLETLIARCRFRDCTHTTEPGCAVRPAIERGEIDPARLESYAKLTRELRYLESLDDTDAMLERKRQAKVANKAMKPFKNR